MEHKIIVLSPDEPPGQCPEGFIHFFAGPESLHDIQLAIREDTAPLHITGGDAILKKNILEPIEHREFPVVIYSNKLPRTKFRWLRIEDTRETTSPHKNIQQLWSSIKAGYIDKDWPGS